ncbi:hypothetical protein GPJ56_004525 [Histomonas meleagridis]|uniref:uncharacterized protein n=1 Tax=Histomonas meleagridis TaxID=135588 RepID=UPI00355A0869|nr:hypothetical protein GPJ56_004525 [Histomonas meleagridis]KAH0797344.1 hypothetical protein GO595_009847 [Histomonas meleagridis]
MDELNTVIKQEKETRIKKTTKDLEDKMLSFISERMAIAQEKINNILSTDESAILNESRIRNLENECQLELDRICLQSNINQTARQQVEDFIRSQAKSILIEMGQNAHKIAGENTEKVIESLKQIAESIMKNEVTAQEYNIKRSDFEKLNRISRNLNDMITNNCINEFKSRYSGSVNESINKKLEDYITSQIQKHMKSLNQLSEEERNKRLIQLKSEFKEKIRMELEREKMSIRTEMQNRSGSPSDVLPCDVASRLNRKCDYVISDANESIRSELKAYSASLLSECVEELKNEAKVISKKSQKFKKGVGKFFKTLGKVAISALPIVSLII